jgi:hypothetical protein
MPWTWLIEAELLLFIFAPLIVVISRSSKVISYVLLNIIVIISVFFSAYFLD